jgi:hypothetical protein
MNRPRFHNLAIPIFLSQMQPVSANYICSMQIVAWVPVYHNLYEISFEATLPNDFV